MNIHSKQLNYGRETARRLLLFGLTSSFIRKSQKCIFQPPDGCIKGNISALSEAEFYWENVSFIRKTAT